MDQAEKNVLDRKIAVRSEAGQQWYRVACRMARARGVLDRKGAVRPGAKGFFRQTVATAVLQEWPEERFVGYISEWFDARRKLRRRRGLPP